MSDTCFYSPTSVINPGAYIIRRYLLRSSLPSSIPKDFTTPCLNCFCVYITVCALECVSQNKLRPVFTCKKGWASLGNLFHLSQLGGRNPCMRGELEGGNTIFQNLYDFGRRLWFPQGFCHGKIGQLFIIMFRPVGKNYSFVWMGDNSYGDAS